MPNPNKGPGNAAGLNATRVYTSGDKQIISITDLISEGPIYGLVDAQASVFLNDDRAAPLDQAATYASQTAATVRLTQNSTTATVSASSPPILAAENGDKYLLVRSVQTIYVTASNGSSSDANGNTVVTLTTTNNTAFFNDSMISSNSGSFDTQVPARLGSFTQAHGAGDGGFGEGKLINRWVWGCCRFMGSGRQLLFSPR